MPTIKVIHNIQWRNYILAQVPLVALKKMTPQFATFEKSFVRN